MNCIFEKLDDEYVKCKVCGLVIHAKNPSKIFTRCPGEPRKTPPILTQANHYAGAVIRHIATGAEKRTDEEVAELLRLCEECEYYSEGRCTVCGCRLSDSKNAYTNKLRMKSQSCPKGRWS